MNFPPALLQYAAGALRNGPAEPHFAGRDIGWQRAENGALVACDFGGPLHGIECPEYRDAPIRKLRAR